jgi:hypothetical protein
MLNKLRDIPGFDLLKSKKIGNQFYIMDISGNLEGAILRHAFNHLDTLENFVHENYKPEHWSKDMANY